MRCRHTAAVSELILFRLQNDFTVFTDMPSLLAIALQPFPSARNLIIFAFWLSVIALFSFQKKTAAIVKAALFGPINISGEPFKAHPRPPNDCYFCSSVFLCPHVTDFFSVVPVFYKESKNKKNPPGKFPTEKLRINIENDPQVLSYGS